MDLSDDVSALSMDGASAIAGMTFARRLRKDFAEMQLGIPEDEEQQAEAAAAAGGDHFDGTPGSRHSSPLREEKFSSNGGELIEPFPKTFEEWQKKKHKKHKHKSKKHHKKSSKSSSRSSRHKEKQDHEQGSLETAKSLPIMEISIQSTNFEPASPSGMHSNHQECASDTRSYHSSIASTASSHSRRSGRLRGSLMDHCSVGQSVDDSHDNTTYMTGLSSAHSQSHQSQITVEDLQQLSINLERAKMDEKQVLEIHERLEKEVQSAMLKAEKATYQQEAVRLELRFTSMEREQLQEQLGKIQDENNRLRSKLRNLEDKETEEGLDDVLNSMEAKIKALKLKSRSSKKKGKER